jgi:hypothetical protein
LLTVADVARLLPRHWDGQRLLRFLTGLALLALAFAAYAGVNTPPPAAVAEPGPVPAIAAAPAPAEAAVPAGRPAAGDVSAIGAQSEAATGDVLPIGAQSKAAAGDVLRMGAQSQAGAALSVVAVALVAGLSVVASVRTGGRLAVPGGVVPGAYGSRGPPLAG